MNRAQRASADRANKLINLFEEGRSSKDICVEMGWNTEWPSHMVNKEITRLKKRGYEVGARGSRKRKKYV